MPDSEAILSADARELRLDDLYGSEARALQASHEALRERVAVLTEEAGYAERRHIHVLQEKQDALRAWAGRARTAEARVAVLTEERDLARTQLRNALDHRHAENDRVAALEAGLRDGVALLSRVYAWKADFAIAAKEWRDSARALLGGVPAATPESTA